MFYRLQKSNKQTQNYNITPVVKMERVHVEITPKNLEFLRKKKENDFHPIKMTVNLAFDALRKKEETIKKGSQ